MTLCRLLWRTLASSKYLGWIFLAWAVQSRARDFCQSQNVVSVTAELSLESGTGTWIVPMQKLSAAPPVPDDAGAQRSDALSAVQSTCELIVRQGRVSWLYVRYCSIATVKLCRSQRLHTASLPEDDISIFKCKLVFLCQARWNAMCSNCVGMPAAAAISVTCFARLCPRSFPRRTVSEKI